MGQYSPATNSALGTVSASMIDVDSDIGACQLTSIVIDNTANSHDGWLHFHDSHDTSSAATGSTAHYKIFCPANSETWRHVDAASSVDADGIWGFATGMTIKFVKGNADTNNEPPTNAVKVYIQTRP